MQLPGAAAAARSLGWTVQRKSGAGRRGAGAAGEGAPGAARRSGSCSTTPSAAGSRRGCSTCPAGGASSSTTFSPLRFYRGTSLERAAARREGAAVGHGAARGAGHRRVRVQLLAELRRAGYGRSPHRPALRRGRALRPGPGRPAVRARLASEAFTLVSVEPRGAAQAPRGPPRAAPGGAALRPDARLLVAGGVDRSTLGEGAGGGGGAHAGRHPARIGSATRELVAAVPQRLGLRVSMSEHEGFGVAAARGDGGGASRCWRTPRRAVPETLGGAGIGFDEKRFALLAELAVRLGTDAAAPGAGAAQDSGGGSRRAGPRSGPRRGSRPRWRAWASGAHDGPVARRGAAAGGHRGAALRRRSHRRRRVARRAGGGAARSHTGTSGC